MAALASITAVRPTSNTTVQIIDYGATISSGQTLYQDSADSKYKLADSNASSATATLKALAITPGINAGSGLVATGGSVILVGTTMAVGETYYVGPTAGSIIPSADLTTGDYVSRLGTAETTTQIKLAIEATGVVRP